jgi:hypothetical protein
MEALAALVGVAWQTVQQWEKPNGTAPKRRRLAVVAKALNTSDEYLVTGRHPSNKVTTLQDLPVTTYCHQNPHIQAIVAMLEQMTDVGIGMVMQSAKGALADHAKHGQANAVIINLADWRRTTIHLSSVYDN